MYKDQEDIEKDELMWVKAGGPGEKPTIIRQVCSDSSSCSSRENSGESSNGVKQTLLLSPKVGLTSRVPSNDSMHNFGHLGRTSSEDSRVIVLNVSQSPYPYSIDKEKVKRLKISQGIYAASKDDKGNTNNNFKTSSFCNNAGGSQVSVCDLILKSNNQPVDFLPRFSPMTAIKRSSSDDSPQKSSSLTQGYPKTKSKEGYTTLIKDSPNPNISETARSKTLPSSWRPAYSKEHQKDFSKFSKSIALEQVVSFQDELYNKSSEITTSQVKLNRKKTRKKFRHNFENVIEVGTCFVCLRSAVYHTQDSDDTGSSLDHPCKCQPCSSNTCGRWCMITLMICFFPFLIFYPPIKACLNIHDLRVKRKKRHSEKREKLKKSLVHDEL
ncbi:uncharacterized protein LOC100204638 isoform X2 [Hydra vulgaris]|uniref:Uncharacterized protein LOC100204638 isoform X2 n=1 Tax=Hydra vulgaris TaxID=6087 RepID=A0ABM4BLP0_HYDVU